MPINKTIMNLEDEDVRLAIISELKRKRVERLTPLIDIYSKNTKLREIVNLIQNNYPNRYEERLCFYPGYKEISGLFDVIMFDIFRDNIRDFDAEFKEVIFKAIIGNRKINGTLNIGGLLKGLNGKELSTGFRIDYVESDTNFYVIHTTFDPLQSNNGTLKVSFKLKDNDAELIQPKTVMSSLFEWAIITFARLAGFRTLSFNYRPIDEKREHFLEKDSYFDVRKENDKIKVSNIKFIRTNAGYIVDPYIFMNDDGIYFNDDLLVPKNSDRHDKSIIELMNIVNIVW